MPIALNLSIVAYIALFPFWDIVDPATLTKVFFMISLPMCCWNLIKIGRRAWWSGGVLMLAAVLVLAGVLPKSAMLIPCGIVFGMFISGLNVQWQPLNPVLALVAICAAIFYTLVFNKDTNFASFYIACIFALSGGVNMSGGKFWWVLSLCVVLVVSFALNSRAFAYATIIYFVCKTLKIEFKRLSVVAVFATMALLSILVTYATTWRQVEVVHLTTTGFAPEEKVVRLTTTGFAPEEKVVAHPVPSLLDKAQNWTDVNRFRISRMWIEDYLIKSKEAILFGLGDTYPNEVRDKSFYSAHNSFLEIVLYFGVPYFVMLVCVFGKSFPLVKFKKTEVFYLLSFGMVLHGVLYFCVIPVFYLLASISLQDEGLLARDFN